MAKIIAIKKSTSFYNMRNDVTYCIAEYNDYVQGGKKFIRLQTFGSNVRQDKGKQSQVLHIDEKIAKEIVEILQETFKL
jgi:lysine/ornithine N-monooxygenase